MESFLWSILANLMTTKADKLLKGSALEKACKVIHREIKKGVVRSLLSALQKIVLDCHKELYPNKFLGVLPIYPPKHRDELKWLDQQRDQLAKELERLIRDQSVNMPFGNINSQLNLTDSSATKNIQLVKEKLIAEILKNDDVPDCYKRRVNSYLFDQVCDHFEWEINYNPQVNNFITHAKLTQLIAQNSNATVKLTLDVELNKLSTPQLNGIVEELKQHGMGVTLNILEIAAGSVKLVLEGSQKGIKRIEELFRSGQLTEVSGIPIKDVRVELPIIAPERTLINLSQWLQNVFEEGWQTVETLLGSEKAELAFSFRNTASIAQAKLIDLGIPHPVVLTIAIMQKADSEREILLQIHTTAEQKYLPPNLQLIVLDDSGMPVLDNNGVALEAQARSADNYIQLSLYGQPGEQFGVKIALKEASVVENFVM